MRQSSLVFMSALLLATAACSSSSDSNDISDPEIRSQDDVQRFFEAVMPELVAAFTELASQQLAPSPVSSKQDESTVPCREGGSLSVDLDTGAASLINCGVRGVIINATLALFVEPTGPSSYQANFNGILMVTGSFVGTVEVIQAFVRWTDPATVDNTSWEVTVLLGDETATVRSDSGGNGGGEPADNACEWDRGRQDGEIRVQVFNAFDIPDILVELSAGSVTCAIEDETRVLQVPVFGSTFPEDRNTVLAGDTFGGSGQALMPLQVGSKLGVRAWSNDQMSEEECIVDATGAADGAAYIDVLGVSAPGALPTIDCGFGFELPGQVTTIRMGGTCEPGQAGEFSCTTSCFDICLLEEVLQIAQCPEGVCVCTCVNYGQF